MSNETEEDVSVEDQSYELSNAIRYTWIAGISASAACLILQCLLFIFIPKIRKLDQKILVQMAVAKFLNTLIEYIMSDLQFVVDSRYLVFALYVQSDAVSICWMFIFTKNLYEKVVQAYLLQKFNFLRLSVLIWILTIPLGALCPIFLSLWPDYFDYYYKVYAVFKFIVCFTNILYFGKIFYVVWYMNKNINRNITDLIKTGVISFLLVFITSLQILLTDLTSFVTDNATLTTVFCLINAYQVVVITLIFLILVKNV